jgi:hypothetical protein
MLRGRPAVVYAFTVRLVAAKAACVIEGATAATASRAAKATAKSTFLYELSPISILFKPEVNALKGFWRFLW